MKTPIYLSLAALLLGIAPSAQAEQTGAAIQPEATTAITERNSVQAKGFMVAAANPNAVQAGYDILKKGGSAADAAVAVQMMLNLVEPQSSGIGGGAFMLYWEGALGQLHSYDGREKAPVSADETYWLKDDGEPMKFWDAVQGGRSVGVPGTLKLMETIHQAYGRLPWADVLQPAIDMAENGFPISQRLAASIAAAQERGLDAFPAAKAYFFNEDGSPKAEGDMLKNPAFARTLRLIAAEGSAPFYTGAIARDIVAAVRTPTNAGMLTLDDLANYEVIERDPVCMMYRAHEVCGMGPPSSGALTVGQILGLVSGFDLPGMGDTIEAKHLFLEASKLAYADRGLYMADSDFVDMPTKGLLDTDYLAERAKLIDPTKAMAPASAGEPPHDEALFFAPDSPRPRHGTSHFAIVDPYGDMVSITTTIETGFGSRVMTNGFLLNNELTDFSFRPENDGKPVANRVEGGKRPRSSMAPTIVLSDGTPSLLIGSPGGSRIIEYVASSIIGILDHGLDPQDAIDRPHVLNRNGSKSDVEAGDQAETIAAALAELGHETNIRDLNSGLHAIQITADGLIGAADERREGTVMGD